MQGVNFVGTFRNLKNIKNHAYILATPDGMIDGISSSKYKEERIEMQSVYQPVEDR